MKSPQQQPKWLSERISFFKHKEGDTTIIISTKVDKWKESLLFGWLSLWTLLGLGIIYFLLFGEFTKEMLVNTTKENLRLYLLAFLFFWAYFQYRILKVYIWRKKGMEYFKISKEYITLKKAFGKYGKANQYNLSNIHDIAIIETKQNSYANVMAGSFWDMGNETISFEYQGKFITFGKQLDPIESKALITFLAKEIKLRLK